MGQTLLLLRPATLALAVVLVTAAGCESTPAVGDSATAQVIAVPRTRAELGGGHADLHAALLAGVPRSAAERGRLVVGECAEPDASRRGGIRWHLASTVLPDGVAAAPGNLFDLQDLTASPGPAARHHGRFVAMAPPLEPGTAVRSPFGDRLHTPCRPPALAAGRMRVQLHRAVAPWEFDFAVPELRRHERFADRDLAAGRVVMVSCQLKVIDGGDWHRPVWMARVPEGLDVRVGQVVTLRTGAAEDSREVEPVAQVLGIAGSAPAGAGNAIARCR